MTADEPFDPAEVAEPEDRPGRVADDRTGSDVGDGNDPDPGAETATEPDAETAEPTEPNAETAEPTEPDAERPSRLRRVASVAAVVLLVAAVLPFVIYAVPAVIGADASFVVLTASMTPAIAPGDVVIVAEDDPASIAAGDVITFTRGDGEVPVTHRVTNAVTDGDRYAYETKGDANEDVDAGLVPDENLIGTVVLTIPYIGYVIQFADTPYGFVLLIVVPFGLLLATELWSVVAGRRDRGGAADPAAMDATTDPAATHATTDPAATDVAGATGGVGVTVDALAGAAAVLLVVAPYAVFVAYQYRTAITLTFAIAATLCLLAAGALWASALDVPERAAAADGGTADEPADSPVEAER